jgi:hypothetical protein
MQQQLNSKRVPWSQLEGYLESHQKLILSMLDLLKGGVMDKPDIENRLPKSFLSLYQIIKTILSDNDINLPN